MSIKFDTRHGFAPPFVFRHEINFPAPLWAEKTESKQWDCGMQMGPVQRIDIALGTQVAKKWSHFRLEGGDILVLTSASFGRPAVVTKQAEGAIAYTGIIRFRSAGPELDSGYLKQFLGSPNFLVQAEAFASGAVIKHFGPTHLKQMTIPLPPIETQRAIVAEIEAEQALVEANRQLIVRFEAKIKTAINRVWGDST